MRWPDSVAGYYRFLDPEKPARADMDLRDEMQKIALEWPSYGSRRMARVAEDPGLQDLPWQGVPVQLWATVSRFRCLNRSCPRKIFCERLPGIARAYARQTERTSEIVRLIGYVAGGLQGQRLLTRLSIATSDDTVLRRIQQEPAQDVSTLPVHNLGVDDWAWRKGQDYGTILVNLDLHRVIDLLPDRAAESFSDWLKQHPEIVTISRDRSGLYAEGADLGSPQSH